MVIIAENNIYVVNEKVNKINIVVDFKVPENLKEKVEIDYKNNNLKINMVDNQMEVIIEDLIYFIINKQVVNIEGNLEKDRKVVNEVDYNVKKLEKENLS